MGILDDLMLGGAAFNGFMANRIWQAGEKYLLTQLGVFRGWSNILNYELTD